MPEQRLINTSCSADLISYAILVDGEELPRTVQVMNVIVEKEINRIPMAKIIILDGDAASADFRLSNETLFIPGKEVEIKAGYHSDNQTIFKGLIIKHSLKIRSNHSYLIIECKDKAVKLTIGRKSNYFYDSTDSDIIEEIIGSYSLEKEVEPTSVSHRELVQYNVSDWDFCVTRAQANGRIVVIDDGKIAVKEPDLEQEAIETVSYGATLMEFDAEIDARNQFQKITSYSWSSMEQELLEIEADNSVSDLNGNLSADDLASVINLENLELKSGGTAPESELQEWADAKMLFNRLSKTRGKIKFQGIATVKPDTMLQLSGVGDRFAGKAYISAIRHQIAEGNWTVDAEFGINPRWFAETFEINDRPAAGLFSAVNGLQVGIVTQLEGDPDGEERILVRLPVVNNEVDGIWARIAMLDAGNERGSFFRPEIEDEVIVGFINDDPNDAVVLGMMNSSAKPAPITASDDNHEKGFITRSKMKFIFNDEKKSAVLETPSGKKIAIDDDAGTIEIVDENANNLLLDSGGITMESNGDIAIKTSGDIKIEGNNLTLTANAQFKAEGTAGAEVSSSATAVLKGSLVQIN